MQTIVREQFRPFRVRPSYRGRRSGRVMRRLRWTERHARGMTLVECMCAVALLALMAVSVSVAVVSGQSESHEAMAMQRAILLAEEMQERIAGYPYWDPGGINLPGPEAGEKTVAQFDNADDFDGYIELPGQLRDRSGNLLPQDFQTFTREVHAQYGAVTVPNLGGAIQGLTVVVTVTERQGPSWSLLRFRPASVSE